MTSKKEKFFEMLFEALDHELTACCVYSHYADALRGRDRILLRDHFQEEALESLGHASVVRNILLDSGHVVSVLPSQGDLDEPMVDFDLDALLDEAIEIETKASELYQEALTQLERMAFTQLERLVDFGTTEIKDSLESVLIDEQEALRELARLKG